MGSDSLHPPQRSYRLRLLRLLVPLSLLAMGVPYIIYRLIVTPIVLSEEHDFFLLKSDSLTGLGSIYTLQGALSKALECFHESLKIAQSIGDKFREEHNYVCNARVNMYS